MKLHKIFIFVLFCYRSYTRDIQHFGTRIVFIICIVDVIYIKTFAPLKSDRLGHIHFLLTRFSPNKLAGGPTEKLSEFYEAITTHQDQKSQHGW